MDNYPIDFKIACPDIFYNMPSYIYHSDPCLTPSLSNSLIRDLLDRSPKHAAWKHPKLFNKTKIEPTPAMIEGSILHKLLLNQGDDIVIIQADDFRGKIAKEQKEKALSTHKLPILEKHFDKINNCADLAIEKISNHPACEGFFSKGSSEAVLAWNEQDIWCRSMVDRLPDNESFPLFDIKGTGCSASPIEWEKRLLNTYRTQGAFYNRGLDKLGHKKRPSMCFIVIEMFEPFEMSVFTLSEELEELAQNEVDRAIKIWRHCLNENHWYGYPENIIEVRPTPWLDNQVENQILSEEMRGLYQ